MWLPVSILKVKFCRSEALAPSGLARRSVELHRLLARALARTRIGAGALPAHRQPLAMPQASPGPQVHESLDIHRHFAAQITLDRPFGDVRTDRRDFGLGQDLDLGGRGYARALADRQRA